MARALRPAAARGLFLAAYASSGAAGLIYEVAWTRLLTLTLGHTTAAASAVVAAFMGGLAAGAAIAGRVSSRRPPRQSLQIYAILELVVIACALLLPFELHALTPLLRWAYRNGDGGVLYALVRLESALLLVFVPAAALGATFPFAIRWFVADPARIGRSGGTLYALNTAGAACGALLAGFLLIPSIGVRGTTLVAIAASGVAALLALVIARSDTALPQPGDGSTGAEAGAAAASPATRKRSGRSRAGAPAAASAADTLDDPSSWKAAAFALGLSGLASMLCEIAWTRVLALMIGPTIYAFSATLAVFIIGLAIGSAIGAWGAGRSVRHIAWLGVALAAAAVATTWVGALAGTTVPENVAERIAAAPDAFDQTLSRGALLVAALIVPTAISLGAAFPLGLAAARSARRAVTERVGWIYATNTIGSVAGSLLAGFVAIPAIGLQRTLQSAAVLMSLAGLFAVFRSHGEWFRIVAASAAAFTIAAVFVAPGWDRELFASGIYLYAPYIPRGLELRDAFKAGTLLYYRDGAAATVSVKRFTGTTSLAIDGKVDASNGGDMLTQNVLGHLPLLMYPQAQRVAIVGLGSGVTAGAVLQHDVTRVDVIEISREVVEASRFFTKENRDALSDPRLRLILGDGRSHLLLTDRDQPYDVIISEPSNPWIAGVASLFTREFFAAARDHLSPNGVICQWAQIYSIGDADLRSIIGTFLSVFPDGMAWLIGQDDLLLVASKGSLNDHLTALPAELSKPRVAEDLRRVGVTGPFALWSMFAGSGTTLARFSAGAPLLTDDRIALEFSAPRQMHGRVAGENATRLAAAVEPSTFPDIVRRALEHATAAEWRDRGALMLKSGKAAVAYDDFTKAVAADRGDLDAVDGLVRSAIMLGRATDALGLIKVWTGSGPTTPALLVARSRLLAAIGSFDDAVAAALQASAMLPIVPAAVEQMASLRADMAQPDQLAPAVEALKRIAPDRAPTLYYEAVLALLTNDAAAAGRLAERAIAADPQYAAAYDLLGAASMKQADLDAARTAFEKSLQFNSHDSTAYTNLGLIALGTGNRTEAARYFAEAVWLDENSEAARKGLAEATAP